MVSCSPSLFRYIPASAADKHWGTVVSTVGYCSHSAHSPYPLGKHPTSHHFEWKNGRILQEFQLVYIVRGGGVFETKETASVRIKEGQAFVLFPGIWHRYTPDPETGWDEYWVGLDGPVPRSLHEENLISEDAPIVSLGFDAELLQLYAKCIDVANSEALGYRQMLSGLSLTILAHIHAVAIGKGSVDGLEEAIVKKTKFLIVEHLSDTIDWNQMSMELHTSYSVLRHIFKRHTGCSLYQYQLQLRLEKAKTLLNKTNQSVKEVAFSVGFNCAYHFSSLFKRKAGVSPLQWRRDARGGKVVAAD